jgi:Transposase DDE domain group 1
VSRVSHASDRVQVRFDDEKLVANAGLLLVGTLVVRLGMEAMVNRLVCLPGRVGGSRPGRKVLTLIHAIVAGASHIDHAGVLRCGGTEAVLPFRVMAPSTLGTFLRAFTFGHVRQLEAVAGETLRRAWSAGAGPGAARLVADVDSTICEVEGRQKQGAAYGYTKVLGYHPILATRADTGEVLHARMRTGSANTARGARRFIDELVARVRRAGATGEIVLRFDSGFWSNDTIASLGRLDVRYTMAVRTNSKGPAEAIAAIDERSWVDIDYTPDGRAQVAECIYNGRRLIVRRTRLTGARQARLWPDWRHFGFLTDLGARPSSSTPSTAATPSSNWPSGTSRRALAWSTCRRATSAPTAPGCSAPCWRTTSCAGPSRSASRRPATPSSPAPSALISSPCRPAS